MPAVAETDLPSRGATYYASLVLSARAVLEAALVNDAVDAAGRKLLFDLLRRCDGLEERWDAVERILESVPTTLALPGFGAKNVRVLDGALVPFDFENAGWGVPAVELRQVDLDAYLGLVRNEWAVDRAQVARLGALGGGLASLKSIPGEASTLSSPWPRRALDKLVFYAGELATAEEAVRRVVGGASVLKASLL